MSGQNRVRVLNAKELEKGVWISLTQAGVRLKLRYLKIRDLAMQGRLGEVVQNETGRYFVQESAVYEFDRKRRGKHAS